MALRDHGTGSAADSGPRRKESSLWALAAETLHYNDGGGYTYPDRDQYPHQWAWDSGFAAIGWAHLDMRRAYRELLTLVAAQNANAMVPHIAYDPRSSAKAYRPEAEAWGTPPAPDGRLISAITQPPVAAIALRHLFELEPAIDAARELVPRLFGWHTFLLEVRDATGSGEPVLIHPWESGRDNSIEWDEPMRLVQPVAVGARADIKQVSAAERPTNDEYGRFHALLEYGRSAGWDQRLLARDGQFRVLDPAFSAILAAACADLAIVASAVGNYDIARQSDAQSVQVTQALLRRADDDGFAWPTDVADGSETRIPTAGTACLALIPGLPTPVTQKIADLVTEGGLASDFGVRSLDASHQLLEVMRYWRGPVWANITWLCALGLQRNGQKTAAGILRERLLDAVERSGMREYFEPDSGEGLGSRVFSWTAAVVLATLAGD